jgi:2-polyprenyl-3-methyl-5-hydroxy-6-metoxy-1,4-benzoquinol methylase
MSGSPDMMSALIDRQTLRRQLYKCNFAATPTIRGRFRSLDSDKSQELSRYTHAHYSNVTDEGDLDQALAGALIEDRYANVPWLNAALPLDGARVLEIGCGTGESTLALAEQGAQVTGIDIDPDALDVGRQRLRLHDLNAQFHVANAVDLKETLGPQTFDAVIFFASLEHMTHDERSQAMADTWAMVRPGGIWSVIEAPNRLWFWDGHTSMSNFYNWLPDHVAWKWAAHANRQAFSDAIPSDEALDPELLARWGRGVSFHDFDLVFGDAKQLDVVSDKTGFLRRANPFMMAHGLVSRTRTYERFLQRLEPKLHPGFFRQYLDLIIRKP